MRILISIAKIFLMGFMLTRASFSYGQGNPADEEYLDAIRSVPNRVELSGDDQELLCQRLAFWYLNYQSDEWLNKVGGVAGIREMLKGKCVDRNGGEWQWPLVGKENALAFSYMITIKSYKDRLRMMLDPVEKNVLAQKNSEIIGYHLLTGEVREHLIEE